MALFNFYEFTKSNRKLSDVVSHARSFSWMHILVSLSKGSTDLFKSFDRDCGRRQQELIKDENEQGTYHDVNMVRVAEHQKKATSILAFILTITTKGSATVLKQAGPAEAAREAKFVKSSIDLYVPLCTPKTEE